MSNSLIEKMAKAIFDTKSVRYFSDGTPITWERAKSNAHAGTLARCRREARAALAAAREPTEAMIRAGMGAEPYDLPCQTTWPRMIDAALAEK